MPIRIRLALAFAVATTALVVIGGLLFVRSFERGLEQSLAAGLRAQYHTIIRTASTVGGGVPVLASRDRVEQILDGRGRVVETSSEAGPQPVISAGVRRAAGRKTVFTNVRVGREQEPFRVLARSVAIDNRTRVVVVATSLEPTREAVRRARDALVLGGFLAVFVAGFGGWLLAGAALRPVERMRRKAADISMHDLTARLPVPSTHDEIATLATTMNELLADLQGALTRERAFVADASHELRTPLAVLRTELELADRPRRTTEELRDAIAHAVFETDRLVHLANQLLFLARHDTEPMVPLTPGSVYAVLDDAISSARARAARDGIVIEFGPSEDVEARIDRDLLRRAVDNLLENALNASPAGGAVAVGLRTEDETAVIEVRDDGRGFPTDFLPHAFDRFRRADDSRTRSAGGTGLGLAIVRAAANAHGGTADVANVRAGGAIATIRIPIVRIPTNM